MARLKSRTGRLLPVLTLAPLGLIIPAFLMPAAISLGSIVSFLYVALGLGLVIFFHELGHFAVAKWCDVKVERFSIGFGPILWSTKRGETEYALSIIPFGGYVKMLGQDDMDPSQMSNEEIAEDPRSYSAKSVPQRMAIISAGVIMNIITGMLFFAIAFNSGVQMTPSVIGGVQPGKPAWNAGLEYGDRITRINDRKVESFSDLMRGVALTSGDLEIAGVKRDGSDFEFTLTPDVSGTKRMIGAAPMYASLRVTDVEDPEDLVVEPGTPAADVKNGFQRRDVIRKAAIAGEEPQAFETIANLQAWLAEPQVRSQAVDFYVERFDEDGNGTMVEEPITVKPESFRTLGLWMDITQIVDIVDGSPAEKAGFKVGDKITHVNGKAVGTEIDPMRLPDYFHALRNSEAPTDPPDDWEPGTVEVVVNRSPDEGGAEDVVLKVRPSDHPGWTDLMLRGAVLAPGLPATIPSIGIAYNAIPVVLHVEPGSPADKAGLKKGERIKQLALIADPDLPADRFGDRLEPIQFDKTENWAYAFRLIQGVPTRSVKLTVSDDQGQVRNVELVPVASKDWFQPSDRGVKLGGLSEIQKADSFAGAIGMGVDYTKNSAIDIYLTLRSLFSGDISPKELHGPVGIAEMGYTVAKQGINQLLLFLGFLSVNLAVVNFLPIPVLDGGHMVFLIWEGVTRSKPSERVLQTAQLLGFLFIVGLMLFVLYLDLFVHSNPG
ncbi:site-2 protease family protein [Thalassoroseus pseudoceratinae]|uniref:site-2 protease family protein n=1 Tax=Thalassoroseus pseudoceratinae TaxID=2713176 RepID=UPI0014204B59|nr:site-2 protease family protein [Thalassoroseus pseudoceratinae]